MSEKPTLTQSVIQALPETTKLIKKHTGEVPAHRMVNKLWRTVVGATIVMGGIAGGQVWAWSQWLVAGMIVLGASVWSSELVLLPLKVILPLVTDLVRAVRGGKSA